MKKQTAVMKLALSFRGWQRDWDRYDNEKINKPKSFDEFIEPFLELEKQQIIESHKKGFTEGTCFGASPIGYKFTNSEQYYSDTYGSKGSDETLKDNHIVDTNEMVSSQTEISDEEIEKGAFRYDENQVVSDYRNSSTYGDFIEGAKWYREQLKKK